MQQVQQELSNLRAKAIADLGTGKQFFVDRVDSVMPLMLLPSCPGEGEKPHS